MKNVDKKNNQKKDNDFIVSVHRRAKLDYTILNNWEAGLVLKGSEVKSLRKKQCQLKNAYVVFQNNEAFLLHLHISHYPPAAQRNHNPERRRKILLNRYELQRLSGQINQKGLSCIPLKMYFKKGKAKVQLALVRGRRKRDKREYIKKKEMNKSVRRALRRNRSSSN